MKNNKFYLGILFVIVISLLVACGKSTITTQPTETTIAITYPTAEYTGQRTVVENASGKIEMGSAGTLPDELSRDVPIYFPGFPTGWSIYYYSGKEPFFEIGIEAGSDQSSVLDWYRSNLLSEGWTIGPLEVDMGSILCGPDKPEVIGAKKDNRILQISVCATSCHTYCSTTISLLTTENN